jgi:uncharacterized protein (TIGR03435 family)
MISSYRILFLLALLLAPSVVLCAPFALAQSQSGAPAQPSFETATIKPTAHPDPGQGYWNYPGQSRFSAHDLSLEFLIQMAWGIEANQLTSKPSWLDSDFYDIEAKPEEGVKLSQDELKPRLQSLLVERFHLATHFETKMARGYALVVAKGGPKLLPTKGSKFPNWRVNTSEGHLEGLNWSMPFLAQMLQRATHVPVADETGIAGSYDIKMQFAPELEQDSALPSLFTALRETLGLELKAQQVPMQVLVIDRIDRVPAAN